MESAAGDAALRVIGGRTLNGEVHVGGAKNAAMQCMAAALLSDEASLITRVPDILDVRGFCEMLQALGASASLDPRTGCVEVRPGSADNLAGSAPDALVQNQRASILLLGALLGRGIPRVKSGPPGGDAIGARSLEIHTKGFQKLGAKVQAADGRIIVDAPKRLRGATLFLDFPSVLGTENLLLAAVRAEGRTTIVNAAREPEVVCMAEMLCEMGARIKGAGADTITIDGVDQLRGVKHALIPDRIEAGTLAIAAAISGGSATLTGVNPAHMTGVCAKLEEAGVSVEEDGDTLTVRVDRPLCATDIQTTPHPGFPTDLQAPMTALLTQAHGESQVWERVFEDRMQHVQALCQMGANAKSPENHLALVRGPSPLTGANVYGGDIRAAAALVVAALAAEGASHIYGLQHLDRGYAQLERKLATLGAQVARLP